jgi:hypothetical protein
MTDEIADQASPEAPKPRRRRSNAEVSAALEAAAATPEDLPPAAPVIFESREREPVAFDVMGIRPTRNFSNGRLEWEVPADQVELFQQNHFVGLCRVVRKAT